MYAQDKKKISQQKLKPNCNQDDSDIKIIEIYSRYHKYVYKLKEKIHIMSELIGNVGTETETIKRTNEKSKTEWYNN